MSCELHWFVMLYKRMTKEDLQELFTENKIKYPCVDESEKSSLKEFLIACRPIKETNFSEVVYYKTAFTEISTLVAIRKIFLHKGQAYFPETDLIFCLKNKLWKQFNKQLAWNHKIIPRNVQDERLESFLRNIVLVTPSYTRLSDKEVRINLENIDEMAKIHFPLCMKTIHSVLRGEHHLKYDCKMQYGIFLKWVGLSYQHAMDLWKFEFTRKMTSDLFERKYSYLFKHQYGLVGGRVHYNPYTCEKILDSCPGPGQHHGCPFKHWDSEKLVQECSEDGFSAKDIEELKQLVIQNQYKEACTLYFSVTHKVYMEDVIKSPNQYVEASYEFEVSLNNCLKNIFEDC